MKLSLSLNEIEHSIGDCEKVGSFEGELTGIASLELAEEGDLSFLSNKKYKKYLAETKASVVLVPFDFPLEDPVGRLYIKVKNTSLALSRLCQTVEERIRPSKKPEIHPSAIIGENVRIGEGVYVGPNVVIEDSVSLGDHTRIEAQVYIGANSIVGESSWIKPGVKVMDASEIGKRVIIQPGAVIGSDGYGYETVDGRHEKIPHLGNVVIEDDVEIGANTTIDRARFEQTRIGEGTKIDNLVQLGHNVEIGKHCFVVAQVGISGSSSLGNYVVVGGQAGLAGHLHVGDQSMIAAQTGVSKGLEPKSYVRGNPAYPIQQSHKVDALSRRLPEFFKRLSELETSIESIRTTE